MTGRQEGDVARLPARVEQRVDGVVCGLDGVLLRRGDEAHAWSVASARVHPARREWSERLVDLASVAQENNSAWWQEKLATNVARDAQTTTLLTDQGWHVIRVWEHEDAVEVASTIEQVVRRD